MKVKCSCGRKRCPCYVSVFFDKDDGTTRLYGYSGTGSVEIDLDEDGVRHLIAGLNSADTQRRRNEQAKVQLDD